MMGQVYRERTASQVTPLIASDQPLIAPDQR